MIRIQNISKNYHLGNTKIEALKGVSMNIDKGEMVCIMGPSGSGKSTMLNIIGCLDTPDDGDVMINGRAVRRLSRNERAEIRSKNIGFIFQSFNLMPVLNVYENIEFPLHLQSQVFSKKEREMRIMKLIEEVGLSEYIRHKPDELSGGQRQRVAIARALVTKPEIILADEPTANLDSKTAVSILELMKMLNVEEKALFVFSTHDPTITRYSTRQIWLKDG
ncbi:MAG TPA: ABC transporter ATP-binding protein, partial [Spirochaetota bacterium]|nr:ABC transporter ATP-binding protein [Spirochaetota bacterium]